MWVYDCVRLSKIALVGRPGRHSRRAGRRDRRSISQTTNLESSVCLRNGGILFRGHALTLRSDGSLQCRMRSSQPAQNESTATLCPPHPPRSIRSSTVLPQRREHFGNKCRKKHEREWTSRVRAPLPVSGNFPSPRRRGRSIKH